MSHKLLLGALGVGIAAGVVYALTRKKEPSPPLERAPEAPEAPRAPLAYLASPLRPRSGARYRARLVLADGLPPFRASATDEEIGRAWGALGFQNVRVMSKASELPAGWPLQEIVASPVTRWVEGTWSLPTSDLARPSAVAAMWQTRSV